MLSRLVLTKCRGQSQLAYGQLTWTLGQSGNYLIEVEDQFANFAIPDYGLALSCNDGTNLYLPGSPPQMQVIYNGTNITSGGTITFPSTIPFEPTNISLIISNSGLGALFVFHCSD